MSPIILKNSYTIHRYSLSFHSLSMQHKPFKLIWASAMRIVDKNPIPIVVWTVIPSNDYVGENSKLNDCILTYSYCKKDDCSYIDETVSE